MITKRKIERRKSAALKRQKPNIARLDENTFIVGDAKDTIKLPEITIEGDAKGFENDVRAMLHSLLLICSETGQGNLKVIVRNGAVYEMSTEITQKR